MNKETSIQKYIDEKKELYKLVLQIIDDSEADDDTIFQKLTNFLDTDQYGKNKSEHFLHLISNISVNHHRRPNFFKRRIILDISTKLKIILIDQIILQHLADFQESTEGGINYYFYPEIDSIIKSGTINNINEENYKLQLKKEI